MTELEYLHERIDAITFVVSQIATIISAHIPSTTSDIDELFTFVNNKLTQITAEFEANKEAGK